MEYRRLGKSGLQLSVLSYGSWVTFFGQMEDKHADELMGVAYDKGINFFDNAETYADGESEKMMGRVLKKKNWDRTSYTVSSKAYFGSRKQLLPSRPVTRPYSGCNWITWTFTSATGPIPIRRSKRWSGPCIT